MSADSRPAAADDILAEFRREAIAASSEVHEATDWSEVAALVAKRAAGGRVAVTGAVADESPEFVAELEQRDVEVVRLTDPRDVGELAVGVVRGRLAVAESGSILVSEDELGDRMVAMLAHHGVQVVDRGHVVASLDDAADWLSERTGAVYASVVTGPSRTADIERSLTIGVQGPASLDVVVLG